MHIRFNEEKMILSFCGNHIVYWFLAIDFYGEKVIFGDWFFKVVFALITYNELPNTFLDGEYVMCFWQLFQQLLS